MRAVRSFVAIDLPGSLRTRLGEQISRLASRVPPRAVRWARPESIHLTLKFLGDVPVDRLGQVQDLLGQVVTGFSPFTIRVKGLGCFPNARRPRVVWVGVHEPSGALAGLRDSLEDGFERLGYRREERAFSPHLTLGRVRRDAAPQEAQAAGEALGHEPVADLGEVHVEAICLIRSDLRPTGAIYTCLAQVSLGSGS